jgi:hypothetical protein
MPHPERHITRTQHFQWTRSGHTPPAGADEVADESANEMAENGLGIFRNAVEYFR